MVSNKRFPLFFELIAKIKLLAMTFPFTTLNLNFKMRTQIFYLLFFEYLLTSLEEKNNVFCITEGSILFFYSRTMNLVIYIKYLLIKQN